RVRRPRSSGSGRPLFGWSCWSRPGRRRGQRKLSFRRLLAWYFSSRIIALPFKPRGHHAGIQAALTQPPSQHVGIAVRDPDLLRAGGFNSTQQAGPVRVIGKDEAAIDSAPPARAPDLHPTRDKAARG